MTASPGALLTAEVADSRTRPLRSVGASSRQRLARALDEALSRWRCDWGLPQPLEARREGDVAAPTVGCVPWADASEPGTAPDASAWRPVDDAVWGLWWTPRVSPSDPPRTHASLLATLSELLFGEAARPAIWRGPAAKPGDARPSLASDVAAAAWQDWCARASRALGPEPGVASRREDPDVGQLLRPWSGALVFTVPWWPQRITMLLASTPRPLREHEPRTELTPVLGALAGHAARVRVQTLPFELELGALASARVGDVLRTTHGIGAPLLVAAPEPDGRSARPICGAYLGKAGSDRAVELLRLPPLSSPGSSQGERSS